MDSYIRDLERRYSQDPTDPRISAEFSTALLRAGYLTEALRVAPEELIYRIASKIEFPESVIINRDGNRRRVRLVDTASLAKNAVIQAIRRNRPVVLGEHGGGVANSYGYYADTQGAVAVGFPDGRSVVWVTFLPARNVTLRGVGVTIGEPDLFDKRVGQERRRLARENTIRDAFRILTNG